MNPKIICFGETLWDMLPDGAMPGGAPMNVAIHLRYNGHAAAVISRVGNDDWGKTLLDFLTEKGLSIACIQQDEMHQTGIVEANVSDKTAVTYTIVGPVAWDYIQYDELMATIVSESDLFIYGSLASRSATSYETLLQYLPSAGKKVFDVNLRPPHYTPKRTEQLIRYANIVKMNHHELTEIMSWFGQAADEKESMEYLKRRFNLEALIVTRGEKGAAVITDNGFFEHPGFQVEIADTIGSGDAFLAAFLNGYVNGWAPDQILSYACAVGAYVATQRGATPFTPENFINSLINSQSITHQII